MKAIYTKRLLKLAAFLDKLPKAKFDFNTFTSLGEKPMMEALKAGRTQCGTTGCAVGWMPAVFPRQVCWVGKDKPFGSVEVALRTKTGRPSRHVRYFDVAERLFGLTGDEVRHLFNPENDSIGSLRWSATAKDVAKHVRKFVREKQKAAA